MLYGGREPCTARVSSEQTRRSDGDRHDVVTFQRREMDMKLLSLIFRKVTY